MLFLQFFTIQNKNINIYYFFQLTLKRKKDFMKSIIVFIHPNDKKIEPYNIFSLINLKIN